jgi:hypothetical protein
MITVGSPKNKRSVWRYQDMPTDKKGWVVNMNYRPLPFDICHLQIAGKDRIINGWWTGLDWVSHRKKDTETVMAWKFNKDTF